MGEDERGKDADAQNEDGPRGIVKPREYSLTDESTPISAGVGASAWMKGERKGIQHKGPRLRVGAVTPRAPRPNTSSSFFCHLVLVLSGYCCYTCCSCLDCGFAWNGVRECESAWSNATHTPLPHERAKNENQEVNVECVKVKDRSWAAVALHLRMFRRRLVVTVAP